MRRLRLLIDFAATDAHTRGVRAAWTAAVGIACIALMIVWTNGAVLDELVQQYSKLNGEVEQVRVQSDTSALDTTLFVEAVSTDQLLAAVSVLSARSSMRWAVISVSTDASTSPERIRATVRSSGQ